MVYELTEFDKKLIKYFKYSFILLVLVIICVIIYALATTPKTEINEIKTLKYIETKYSGQGYSARCQYIYEDNIKNKFFLDCEGSKKLTYGEVSPLFYQYRENLNLTYYKLPLFSNNYKITSIDGQTIYSETDSDMKMFFNLEIMVFVGVILFSVLFSFIIKLFPKDIFKKE